MPFLRVSVALKLRALPGTIPEMVNLPSSVSDKSDILSCLLIDIGGEFRGVGIVQNILVDVANRGAEPWGLPALSRSRPEIVAQGSRVTVRFSGFSPSMTWNPTS